METEWRKDGYLLSTDKSKIDVEAVHRFLSHSYWAENIPSRWCRKVLIIHFVLQYIINKD